MYVISRIYQLQDAAMYVSTIGGNTVINSDYHDIVNREFYLCTISAKTSHVCTKLKSIVLHRISSYTQQLAMYLCRVSLLANVNESGFCQPCNVTIKRIAPTYRGNQFGDHNLELFPLLCS